VEADHQQLVDRGRELRLACEHVEQEHLAVARQRAGEPDRQRDGDGGVGQVDEQQRMDGHEVLLQAVTGTGRSADSTSHTRPPTNSATLPTTNGTEPATTAIARCIPPSTVAMRASRRSGSSRQTLAAPSRIAAAASCMPPTTADAWPIHSPHATTL